MPHLSNFFYHLLLERSHHGHKCFLLNIYNVESNTNGISTMTMCGGEKA